MTFLLKTIPLWKRHISPDKNKNKRVNVTYVVAPFSTVCMSGFFHCPYFLQIRV
jgi:hypothetical protein